MSTTLSWLRSQPLTTAHFLLQRRVRHPARRAALADVVARSRPRPTAAAPVEGSEWSLVRDGYQPVPGLVGAEQAATLRAYFEGFDVSDPYHPEFGRFRPEDARPETHVGYFDPEVVLRAPRALAIANDPRVLGAVGAALGAKPLISYMAAWWSVPHPGEARQAEMFHRDIDDWRFIKLFIYLTDVDEDSGPHAYVPGSHAAPALNQIQRYRDEEVEGAYGRDKILTITGGAGDAFLENTFGLHRGVPPRSKRRLLFQVLYGLTRSPYGPARPLLARGAVEGGDTLDPYVNGVYLGG